MHKHLYSQMKAWVHQLRLELKTTKKGNHSISKYVLQIRVLVDSLLDVGDPISERDKIDAILQGLLEEYNPLIMMIHGKVKSTNIYDVEALLYVQETQLDKFFQELLTPSVIANVSSCIQWIFL